jgi:DMSO/TMAO reductase YedYZ molybdopterin-dependent catalytic subunit
VRAHAQSAIRRLFPFTSFYTPNLPDLAPVVDPDSFALDISGLAERAEDWSRAELHPLPCVSQVTRPICIEGWSAAGRWAGVRLSDFITRIGAIHGKIRQLLLQR